MEGNVQRGGNISCPLVSLDIQTPSKMTVAETPGPLNLTLTQLEEKFLILQENMDFFFLCVMGVIISLLCGFMFWLIGYTIAFGEGSSFMGLYYYQGGKDMFSKKQYAHFFFQLSYASTPSTITSGAVVDRISLIGYITYSSLISGVVYPIVCHWVWTAEGWLTVMGFKDFCGSSALHLMSGLGGMIIYTGFFAFNGGSVVHISKLGDGEMVGKIMIITWLASSGGAFGTLLWFRLGLVDGNPRWSLLNALNAGLSGMASVSAHCDAMDMWAGFVSGLCVSVTYCGLHKLTRKLKIDDPIDVIAVHFGGGLWGTIGSSMLRQDSFVGGFGYKGGWYLAYQTAGALAIILWSWACIIVMFGGLRLLGLLRADITKHREQAYQGIMCRCEYMQKKHDMDVMNLTDMRSTAMGHPDLRPPVASSSTAGTYDLSTELQNGLNFRHLMTSVNL
ncbi:hypothetical protein B566_EDAN005864 [Ephemera danica]|nr:hypothetical protein B566_EDAN005864 [Ephemera danica]